MNKSERAIFGGAAGARCSLPNTPRVLIVAQVCAGLRAVVFRDGRGGGVILFRGENSRDGWVYGGAGGFVGFEG